jgi:hypothetical protein
MPVIDECRYLPLLSGANVGDEYRKSRGRGGLHSFSMDVWIASTIQIGERVQSVPVDELWSLIHQSIGTASRSTALKPLGWLVGITTVPFVAVLRYRSPFWVTVSVMCLLFAGAIVYLCSYVFLLFNNVDALRSENFALKKMELQQSRTGDSQMGFSTRNDEVKLLTAEPESVTISKTRTENDD